MTATIDAPVVRVTSEPLTYEEHAPRSYFQDLARAQLRGDVEAQARLDRHAVEMRINPNTRTAQGGEFTVPLWLVDKFASASRAGRVLADLLNPLPLPDGVSQIHIPKMTTGSLAGIQPADNDPGASQDIVTADAVSTTDKVVTIDGFVDVSQQLFDQAPAGFDTYAYIDLNRAYNRALEVQLLTGVGTAGFMTGVANVASIPAGNTVSGSAVGTGSTSVNTLWPLIGQACANVGNNRSLPVEIILMAIRRWDWIGSSLDNSARPIQSPGQYPHTTDYPIAGGFGPVGTFSSRPVYADGAILTTAAAADVVYCLRPSDMFLFEGAPRLLVANNPGSGNLQIRISLHRYVAFVGGRYPSGIGQVTAIPAPVSF